MSEWLLAGKPYEVQRVALEKMKGKRGFALLAEMGLGKSAIVLAEFKQLLVENKVDVLVVVCPSSLKRNWLKELDKWETGLTGLSWDKYREGKYDPAKTPVMAINYEAFSGGACRGYKFMMALTKGKRVMMVLDESVQVKNHDAARTRNLLAVAPFCTYVRILSGAPCTQGPHDLYAQLRMIGAIHGWNYYAFRNRYCKMGGFMSKQVVGAREQYLGTNGEIQYPAKELHEILDKWGFRAKKSEWTDLPPKLPPTILYPEMNKEQKRAYQEMADDFVVQIRKGEYVEAQAVITQLLKLQQISSGFIIDGDKVVHELADVPPKTTALIDAMEDCGSKMLIFVHFRQTAFQLQKNLMEGYNPAIMIGQMSDDDVEKEKEKFASDASCRGFIIQTQTGKYGHTLLGDQTTEEDSCHAAAFYENSYSLDDRVQAEDRPHRHGQTFPVSYLDFVSSPIELSAITALQRKEDIASLVVDGIKRER